MGGVVLGLVVLGSVRKQAEQASKQHPSMASASALVSNILQFEVLPWLPSRDGDSGDVSNQISPFFPKWLLVMVFISAGENLRH